MENRSVNGNNGVMQGIYPLSYIETSVSNTNSNQSSTEVNNSTVYGTAGQKIFYQDSNRVNVYTSISGQTATIIPASAIQVTVENYVKTRDVIGAGNTTSLHKQSAPHAQIVHHGGNTYLVQSSTRIENETPNVSHTTKASPVTVQWLCDNYETADGVSLPRSTLYNHYLQHCQHEKLEPMNQASFGKLIRSVFFGLRTRRLGTRGNSKYHYYGIRIKPNSSLNHFVDDQSFAMYQYQSFHRQNQDNELSRRHRYGTNNTEHTDNGLESASAQSNNNGAISEHSNFLGESSSALPNIREIITQAGLETLTESDCLAEGVSLGDISVFCQMYLDHSDAVLNAVVYLNFKFIESLWQDFWRSSSKVTHLRAKLEEKMPTTKLHCVLKLRSVQNFLQFFDNVFYQSLVEVLIPNVLRPIPSALTQNIRHFAKFLEGWMSSATVDLSPAVVKIKMSCVCSLAQTLRRHTSLNHLAQAARAVLKNANQITQMLTDLNRVDFSNVQEQASWVCGCDNKRVEVLQQDFKRILEQQASLEEWATWLDNVVNEVMAPFNESSRYSQVAHQFMLKWSFYSSMVIRDLTLRSAASFGSFHLIRLLYDEYIYYLIEQKIADHLNQTPVAVTGELCRQLMSSDSVNYGSMDLKLEIDDSGVEGKSPSKMEYVSKMKCDLFDSVDVCHPSGVGADAVIDCNRSVSVDEQVDESADDDEGLEEDECQINDSLSLKQRRDDLCRVPVTIVSSNMRKTVNVTTFGDSSRQSSNDITNLRNTTPKISVILSTVTNLKLSPSIPKTSLISSESIGSKRIKLVNNSNLTLVTDVTSSSTSS